MIDTIFKTSPVRHFHKVSEDAEGDWPEAFDSVFHPQVVQQALTEIRQWPDYQPTPLRSFEGLARELDLAGIYYKDEASRFGLGSFKALGGAYAVLTLLRRELDASFESIRDGGQSEAAKRITVATATDGNHGRSVAWGAQQFGCRCVIYIHADVSEGRKAAIEAYGATVVRVDSNYDDSVRQAAADAEANGWFIVSDTSYAGYEDLPRQVMAGYALMVAEAGSQLPSGTCASHALVQGGVGGLAAAVCGYHWQMLGADRPRLVVVEPERADCLYQSAVHGKATAVEVAKETVMAGLSCGEVSTLAWPILSRGTEDFLTIDDELVGPTMRMLAEGIGDAQAVVAGESAVAGLAALIAIMQRPELAAALGLDGRSQVLLFGTEGATDPVIYEELVGRPPQTVQNTVQTG